MAEMFYRLLIVTLMPKTKRININKNDTTYELKLVSHPESSYLENRN